MLERIFVLHISSVTIVSHVRYYLIYEKLIMEVIK